MAASPGPIRARERVFEVDVLRGFALLGILLVNMDGFAWPITENRLGWRDSVNVADQMAGWLIRFLAQGKFFTLFSLLFGLGFAVQMSRAESRGASFLPTYLRRVAVLFAFGLLHINLLWAGDILTDYAILGCLLLLFRKCRPVVLVRWAAVALALPILLISFAAVLAVPLFGAPDESPVAPSVSAEGGVSRSHRAVEIYQRGSFAEMRAQRLREVRALQVGGIVFEPIVFAMFLLGLALGRARVPERIAELMPRIRRLATRAAAIGVAANLIFVMFEDRAWAEASSSAEWISEIGFIIGGPTMMIAYAAGITVLLQAPGWARRLAPLAATGRMPLTNYLAQSVICTTIFNGYGLGLFARIGVAAGIVLAIAIFAAQVAFSSWWFTRFQFGPLEWIWRALTYGPRVGSTLARRQEA
jgi:uncharacterized protein